MHIQFSVFNSSDPTHKVHGKDAVDAWYDEIKDHVFGVEPKTTGTGHFTQVVWKDSKNLGVGMSK
jgi:glioma pathogenesis-related protein 2